MRKNIHSLNIFKYHFGSKKIFYSDEARKKLLNGINIVCKTTQITLGPKGRNVAIEYELGLPQITKDGVTVAKNIHFAERTKEMGAALLRRVSHNTNLYAGDGTTTSTILANAIIEDGMRFVKYDVNPFEIKKGIEKSRDKIIEFLEEICITTNSKEDLYNVARVSSNYNVNIAKIVSDALWDIGVNGIIEIEPGTRGINELFFTEGITLNRGFASSEFLINKNQGKIEFDFPLILIANQTIDQSKLILPILEKAKQLNKPLFIICKDISDNVLSNLLFNVHKGILEICAITMPGQGDFTKSMLQDLAILCGGFLFDESDPEKIMECSLDHLGKARKVKITQADTFISGPEGNPQEINHRIEELRVSISKNSSPTSLMILKDRLSRMTGKMAVILCGGSSEMETYENRERIVDALNATKLAMKHGLLPGGAISYLYASKILDFLECDNEDQNIGRNILKKALRKPIEILMENGGLNGKFIAETLMTKYNDNMIGYDLISDTYANMFEKGIIDCFLIVKTALEDAVSIASMILTTEVVIANEKIYIPKPLSHYPRDPF